MWLSKCIWIPPETKTNLLSVTPSHKTNKKQIKTGVDVSEEENKVLNCCWCRSLTNSRQHARSPQQI